MISSAEAWSAGEELGTHYWRDGYVIVRNRFHRDEIAGWRAECDRLWSVVDGDPDTPRVQWRGHAREGQVRDRIDPVVDISPVFAALAADPRIVSPAREVLRAEPALMKAKLIIKRRGTAGYAMHQDYPYWAPLGIPADDLLTLLVSIDPARADNGAVEVFARLHHRPLESRPSEPLDVDESRMDLSRGRVAELAPGDLLLFHSLTPHRSGSNGSGGSRRALFFTYTTAAHGDVYRRYHDQQRFAQHATQ
jgi:ectoine hydroxylase-related dioxygenase (phytanoyl-CoA dioxygenase family)